ncbi:MAG TPA: fructosamine kinase family protein [Polyangia bacterium]|nr:fructosamine kinase family protein [Polyangia bacterium]
MRGATRAAVEAALGAKVERLESLSGGDINDAYRAVLAGGRTVFVKTNDHADAAMFPAEARGLAFLAAPQALAVPQVLAVSGGESGAPSFLVLEYLEPGRRSKDFDERLGQGLAALHRSGAPGFGLDHDNFIGRLPQSNAARPTWAEFYVERRLDPQLRTAADSGRATRVMTQGFEALFRKMSQLVGPEEPASRLHGDLWGGNLHATPGGEPCLIDPAVYGGHREMDLAMMQLFGGFSSRTFSAYAEAFPLARGHEGRVPLYQLYPLMVHVNLFGGSYGGSVEHALSRYV